MRVSNLGEWIVLKFGTRSVVLSLLVLAICGWTRGAGNNDTGQALISIGAGDEPNAFINFLKTVAVVSNTATDPYPRELDSNGYPNNISSGGGALPHTLFGNTPVLPIDYYNYSWVIDWQGTCGSTSTAGLSWNTGAAITVSAGKGFVVGGTGFSLNVGGTNGSVTFTMADSGPQIVTFSFPQGASYSGCTNVRVYRLSDQTALNAGQIYTPEFITALQHVNPSAIRTMGWTLGLLATESDLTNWAYRTPLTSITYSGSTWPTALWAGSTSGTDQYTIGAAPSTPGSYTDGEAFTAFVGNASAASISISGTSNNGGSVELTVSSSTTLANSQNLLIANCLANTAPAVYMISSKPDATHVILTQSYSTGWSACTNGFINTTTIDTNGRGVKFVTADDGFGAPNIGANSLGTFIYDAPLGNYLWFNEGVTQQVPFEAQVSLANTVGVPLWVVIPPHLLLSSYASMVQYFSANLTRASFNEYDNEEWNFIFPQAQWAVQRGYQLGLSLSSNQAAFSFHGLQNRLYMATASSNWSQSASLLHRMNCSQEYATPSQVDTYELKGSSLCGTSCGNSVYQSVVGTDYNSSPNRPGDFTDGQCFAIYVNGSQFASNCCSAGSTGYGGNTYAQITVANGLIAQGTNYAGGGSGITTALNWVDSDYRNGTGGATGQPTLAYVLASIYPGWVSEISSNWSSMGIYAYEGGPGNQCPTASWLASQGDSSSVTDAANCNSMLLGYKNDARAKALENDYIAQFLTAGTNVKAGAQLGLQGGGAWSLLPGYVIPAPFTTWQMYYGFCEINNRPSCVN